MQTHELLHTEEKLFPCKFCKKKYQRKDFLNTHERTHTGEKPYSCNHCEKKFPSHDFNHKLVALERECMVSKQNFGQVEKISEDFKKELDLTRERVKQLLGNNVPANTTSIKIL